MIAGPGHFAALASRLRWDPLAFDLESEARAWAALDAPRRHRLTTLLAGFYIAEHRVADELAPFRPAAHDPVVEAVLAAQQADEERHAIVFDRIATDVLGIPGEDVQARHETMRPIAPRALLDLFERRLPETVAALAAGRAELAHAVALYHLVLEGVVLSAGQKALLADVSDGALPNVRAAIERVERDERWHVGFGLRLLIELRPEPALLTRVLTEGEVAARAWGAALPPELGDRVVAQHRRRLTATGWIPERRAGHATVGRAD